VIKELEHLCIPDYSFMSADIFLCSINEEEVQEDAFPIAIHDSVEELKESVHINDFMLMANALQLRFSASKSFSKASLHPLRVSIVYTLRFTSDTYYLPLLNVEKPHDMLPTTTECETLLSMLKERLAEINSSRDSGERVELRF
jgi:hypothetical protein